MTLDRAVNQEMHLRKKAGEQRNRFIRSKISEYQFDLWTWLNSGQMRTPTGIRWESDNYITRCHKLELVQVRVPVAVGVSWGQDASLRISLQTEGLGSQ